MLPHLLQRAEIPPQKGKAPPLCRNEAGDHNRPLPIICHLICHLLSRLQPRLPWDYRFSGLNSRERDFNAFQDTSRAHLTLENETFKGPHSPQECHYRSSWANITWQRGRFYKINNGRCTLLTAVLCTEWNTATHRRDAADQHSPRQGDRSRNCEAHFLSAKCTVQGGRTFAIEN